MVVARPIEFVAVVFKPAAWVLQGSARVLLRPFGIREVVAGDSITSVDDLRAMVDEAEGAGVIPAAQEELLYNAFDFPDQEVRDIMVPAPDVAWLDADLSPEAALDRVLEFPHERYPVGHGSLDQLAGVVHVRDLIAGARGDAAQTVGELARAVPVVPETKDLGALLREQREAREQLAVVADEYGGTAGIVSLEDILEQLVGEIEDEYDLPNASLTWVDARTVLASGSISIDDFNEAVGTELPREGQKTLAGVIFDALGRQPREGDAVSLAEVDACVTALDGVRITELRLRIPDEAGQLRGPSPRRRVGGIRGDDRDPRS